MDANGVDCAAIPPRTTDCDVEVTYMYLLENVGAVSMDITEVQRTRGDSTVDLINEVDPTLLAVGESTKVPETETVDFCVDNTFKTTVTAKADPPAGVPCEAMDMYTFNTVEPPVDPTTPPTLVPVTPAPTPVVAIPTPAPVTPMPTMATPVPTELVFPPGDSCFVQVDVDCTPPPGIEDCDSIPIPQDECLEKVFSMGFRYNGGDCSQSSNVQDPQLFQCEDFFGGPPTIQGEVSFIRAIDIKGLGINYFMDFVAVGDQFQMTNMGNLLGSNINATIYSTDVIISSNIRQTMVIHTSCSQVTFLKDRYGAIELLSFNNTLQGFVSCFVDLSLGFDVSNVATGFNVLLETLTSITNFDNNEFINLTSFVQNITLSPGSTFPISTMVTIDLSIRKRYTAFSTIQGSSPDGFSCRASDFLNITAGNTATSPFVPNLAPSNPPV